VVTAEAAGDISLSLPYHTGGTLKLDTGDVLYEPEFGLNLLSCSRLASSGVATEFYGKRV
jgi:hypothetical protein